MNKKLILSLLLILVVVFSLNNKKIRMATTDIYNRIKGQIKYYTDKQTKVLSIAANSLLKAGLSKDKLQIVLPQLAFETGHFKSYEFETDNNLSGITWIDTDKYPKYKGIQKNTLRGNHMPLNESKTGYYAKFVTIDDWAVDYLRILNNVGKNRPLQANNISDFTEKLYYNGYFVGDTKLPVQQRINQYKNGLISIQKLFQPLFINIL